MTKIRNSKPVSCFGNWILEFEIYLEFGAWTLEFLNPCLLSAARCKPPYSQCPMLYAVTVLLSVLGPFHKDSGP